MEFVVFGMLFIVVYFLIKKLMPMGMNTIISEGSGGKSSQVPGINCPCCGKFIPITITDLLVQPRIRCPYCLLVLNINKK